jgi:hypothetical protein
VLANTFDAPTLVTTGIIIVIAMVLGYRLINRDPNVRRTRWGIYVERDHFDEGESWSVDPLSPESEVRPVPLPPPTPPPPLPPRPDDDDELTQVDWPERK